MKPVLNFFFSLALFSFFAPPAFSKSYDFEAQLVKIEKGIKEKEFHLTIEKSSIRVNGYKVRAGLEPLVVRSVSELASPESESSRVCFQGSYLFRFKRSDQKKSETQRGCLHSATYQRLHTAFSNIKGYAE